MKYALLLLLSSVAQAATTPLPNLAVLVDLRTPGVTDVTVGGAEYQGASAFYSVLACAMPNTARYRCSIQREDNVVLQNVDHSGATVVVTLLVKFESILVVSGHQYWKQVRSILDGSVMTP